MRAVTTLVARAALLALAIACAPAGPRALRLGEEACGYCRMTITDPRFGAQARTPHGKTLTFDSIECLADWAAANDGAATAWVADFRAPAAWIPAAEARYVRLTRAGSPMGRGVAAVRAGAGAAELAAIGAAGPAIGWDSLVAEARDAR
ncbi:MAG: nitrous oxide reductase accessory protein NosL [Gemmatimonadaceae bacterium]